MWKARTVSSKYHLLFLAFFFPFLFSFSSSLLSCSVAQMESLLLRWCTDQIGMALQHSSVMELAPQTWLLLRWISSILSTVNNPFMWVMFHPTCHPLEHFSRGLFDLGILEVIQRRFANVLEWMTLSDCVEVLLLFDLVQHNGNEDTFGRGYLSNGVFITVVMHWSNRNGIAT